MDDQVPFGKAAIDNDVIPVGSQNPDGLDVQTIRDDFYKLDERKHALVGTRTGREFRLGQPVRVTIQQIDMARRQLDLELRE